MVTLIGSVAMVTYGYCGHFNWIGSYESWQTTSIKITITGGKHCMSEVQAERWTVSVSYTTPECPPS